MRKMGFIVLSSAVGSLAMIAGRADAVTYTVNGFNTPTATPTANNWYAADVRTGGTASVVDLSAAGGNLQTAQPLPTGAAKLTDDSTNAAKAEVFTYADFGAASTFLASATLSYSYYKQFVSATSGNASAPSMKIEISGPAVAGGDSDHFGALVYEPYWNNPGNADPTTNAWQNVSITSTTGAADDTTGGWWWNGGYGQPNGAGGPPLRSLAEWAAALGTDAGFSAAHVDGIGMGVGTYNPDQIDYFDAVSFSTPAGGSFTYDFQVPEPGSISLLGLAGAALVRRRRAM